MSTVDLHQTDTRGAVDSDNDADSVEVRIAGGAYRWRATKTSDICYIISK